jgi:hypothetical protein
MQVTNFKQLKYDSANQAQLTNAIHHEWHAKLQVMIGFSIADARKALALK